MMRVQRVRIGNVVSICCFLDGTCRDEVREEVVGWAGESRDGNGGVGRGLEGKDDNEG